MPRRRVTYTQLESLWEFLNENRSIATGFNKTARARDFSRRMWEVAADILNSHGDGAVKDWKSWNKYWNDYKSKLKAKVAAARASQQRTGGGPSSEAQLTELELKFLQILGEDYGAGLPGARVEPFDVPILENSDVAREENADSIDVLVGSAESVWINVAIPSTSHESVEPIPASQSPSPVPCSSAAAATPLGPGDPASAAITPRRRGRGGRGRALGSPRSVAPAPSPRSPRHRIRRRRRELPMTMDTARRSLIAISEQRAVEDRRRNDLLETLVQEIREIKEILSSRLPGLPSTDE